MIIQTVYAIVRAQNALNGVNIYINKAEQAAMQSESAILIISMISETTEAMALDSPELRTSQISFDISHRKPSTVQAIHEKIYTLFHNSVLHSGNIKAHDIWCDDITSFVIDELNRNVTRLVFIFRWHSDAA